MPCGCGQAHNKVLPPAPNVALPSDFHWQSYVIHNPDVVAYGVNAQAAQNHWKHHRKTYLPAINFNWKNYVNRYPDLQKAGINTEEAAVRHYAVFGRKENRDPQ